MSKISTKLIAAGLLASCTVGTVFANSVATELNTAVRKAVENPRYSAKGNRKVVKPFMPNHSGLLLTPERKSEMNRAKASSSLPTIYGSMIYNDDWYYITYGSAPVGYY